MTTSRLKREYFRNETSYWKIPIRVRVKPTRGIF